MMDERGDTLRNEKQEEAAGGAEQEGDESERGRPSTPKWWRPPIPPETYKWEEVRRQRQKGGYPWTHLDKDEEIDADDYLDDNLYEPVNPPPLYGNDGYLSKELQQVPRSEGGMIDIPPEIEIVTSEGLDGLDKPDPMDKGFDGDREWQNASEDEGGRQSRSSFKAGRRGESRSTTPKSVGFSPETITHETPAEEDIMEDQEVPGDGEEAEPSSSHGSRGRRSRSNSPGRKQTAFAILKLKAADAAENVRQRIRSVIPERPKFTKSSRKRRKLKHEQTEESGEQEVPEGDAEMKEGEAAAGEEQAEKPAEESGEAAEATEQPAEGVAETEEEKSAKQKEKDEKEQKKAEEKLAKQKAEDEKKQAKLEEKLAKAREAEEKRQAKAEEEKKKQQEKEEAAKKAAEEKKAEEERKAAEKKAEEERKAAEKAAKEEAARKAAEAKKAEEEAKKAAEKAKKEEEARKKAEAKKAEEEKKAAEKAKKEEEAKKAAEAKKAEEERKAAEKAAKEEEARLAAEAKKAAEEEARKEAEAKKAAEDAAKAEQGESEEAGKAEEGQGMETSEEKAEGGEEKAEEGGEEGMEVVPPTTPSGTTKRKYIKNRRQPIQLSEIPNPITALRNQVEEFKNKIRRSRTPPRRPIQRKGRRSRSADASKSPPRDPDEVSQKTEEGEGEQEAAKATEETEAKPEAATEEGEQQQASPQEGEEDAANKAPSDEPATDTIRRRRRRHHPAVEKIDKVGGVIKGVGETAIDILSTGTNAIGNTLNAIGRFGAKVLVEVSQGIEESRAKSEPPPERPEKPAATSAAEQERKESVPEPTPTPSEPSEAVPPKRTFRFKRRGESQDEEDEDPDHFYENAQEVNQENALLGSGARDWESPQDRHSRGVSEERSSPPGSSLASSTIAQVRRTGVLEEIDSDEFFLRERGISEGEDEEEVNRFLVEELRQAFRPSLSNALAGFDMEDEAPRAPPPRPERTPRKPPRKDKESAGEGHPSMYQTFPPERPKRKQPQGYVSKFMKENEGEEGEYEEGSNEEVRGSTGDIEEDLEESDAMQMVKDKLSELDRDLEEAEDRGDESRSRSVVDEYEDDGRYEPINDGPTKPTRTKRKQPKRPPTPPSFYYNTIAANEWLRELEHHTQGNEPAPPVRKRRGSGKSSSIAPSEEGTRDDQRLDHIPTYSEPSHSTAASVAESGAEDNADYVDEAGYAIVQKDRDLPKTIPRKKKKRTNLSGQAGTGGGQDPSTFFSLPRGSPPTRPNRTYSTLRPRRPPRSKSSSRQNLNEELASPTPSRREGDEPRPSTAIGIMQGRPLPPPPRPQRSPAPPMLGEIEQRSLEEEVGLRHYANFEDMEARTLEETSPPRIIEVDTACQTDPVPEDEFIVGLTEHTQVVDSGIVRTASLRLGAPPVQQGESQQRSSSTTAGDVSSTFQTPPPRPPPPQITQPPADTSIPSNNPSPCPSPFSFPTRLHLEQLEVDFLRVNDLVAQTIKVEHLQASNIEVNSLSASGPVSVSRIQTDSLNSDEVNCSRLSSDTVDMPSIPPSSFFQLSSSSGQGCKPGSEQELCLKAEEKAEKENESACPPDLLFDSLNNLTDENVDSTNDLKSSHVTEKFVDKQLNLSGATPSTDSYSQTDRPVASVGPNIPAEPPSPQLNNLNQSSAPRTLPSPPAEPTERSVTPVEEVPKPPARREPAAVQQPQPSPAPVTPVSSEVESAGEVEEEEENDSENVVCGSFTMPYSSPYPPVSTQSPPATPSSSSLSRTSSLKKSQRSLNSVPRTPPATRRSDAQVAFGHTSVAQGEVLSVKLSIPVERGAIGQAQDSSNSSPGMRIPPPRSRGSRQLPESTTSQADSSRRDAQKKMETERNSTSASAASSSAPAAPSTPPAPRSTPPRPQASVQEDSEEAGFFETSARLGRAVLRFGMRALQAMADYIDTAASEDPNKVEQQRANMQVLLCLLLVLLVGLILATTRSGPYSSPRWEFLMPPPDL